MYESSGWITSLFDAQLTSIISTNDYRSRRILFSQVAHSVNQCVSDSSFDWAVPVHAHALSVTPWYLLMEILDWLTVSVQICEGSHPTPHSALAKWFAGQWHLFKKKCIDCYQVQKSATQLSYLTSLYTSFFDQSIGNFGEHSFYWYQHRTGNT